MQVNRYQSFLRVAILVTTAVLMFDSGFLFPVTKQLSDSTITYIANVSSGVGATATVPENEINVLTAQISERERELDAREATLREREIAARDFDTGTEPDYSIYIISIILFFLTVLLVLNYAMDWARVRAFRYEKPDH